MNAIDSSFFDTIHNRWNTGSVKYSLQPTSYSKGNIIPMWIADMDFKVPPVVENELDSKVHHAIFGYTDTDIDYDELVVSWYKKRMSWGIHSDWIIKMPGVMFAIAAAIRALSQPNDSVLICQPVYHPFSKIITANNRNLIITELVLNNGRYEIDFQDFENKIRENSVKIFLFCSPHNPVGRVWRREELSEIGRICDKYDVYIISDEIHSDFIFTDRPHIPISSLSERLAQRVITCTSPTKTFNLAGLQVANIFIPNSDLRLKIYKECFAAGYGGLNTMAIAAAKAVYKEGEPWLNALLLYLSENYRILKESFPNDSRISLINPEGTYLAWLDCRKLGISGDKLKSFFLDKAGVWLHNGTTFGAGGSGFVRMNIACPQSVLSEAIDRIMHAINA